MAASFARFTTEAGSGGSAAPVVEAMMGYPFMVGGTSRTCSDVMEVAAGRVWVKLGAEGVYGGGVTGSGLGFAIKVADGGRRAVEVALVRTLECLGVLDASEVEAVARHGRPEIRNTRDEVVGEIRPAFDFTLPAR
jgi:L-asparaginase II